MQKSGFMFSKVATDLYIENHVVHNSQFMLFLIIKINSCFTGHLQNFYSEKS